MKDVRARSARLAIVLAVLFLGALGIRLVDIDQPPAGFPARFYTSAVIARGDYLETPADAPARERRVARITAARQPQIEPRITERPGGDVRLSVRRSEKRIGPPLCTRSPCNTGLFACLRPLAKGLRAPVATQATRQPRNHRPHDRATRPHPPPFRHEIDASGVGLQRTRTLATRPLALELATGVGPFRSASKLSQWIVYGR